MNDLSCPYFCVWLKAQELGVVRQCTGESALCEQWLVRVSFGAGLAGVSPFCCHSSSACALPSQGKSAAVELWLWVCLDGEILSSLRERGFHFQEDLSPQLEFSERRRTLSVVNPAVSPGCEELRLLLTQEEIFNNWSHYCCWQWLWIIICLAWGQFCYWLTD